MKTKIITMFFTVFFLFVAPIITQANTLKIKVVYNGVNLTNELQPFIKNNIMYTIDWETIKIITPSHDMKIFPIFQKFNGKWLQTSNIFTNTEWKETMNIVLISIEPNSHTYLIKRNNKIVKIKLDNIVLPYPEKKQKGFVFYANHPLSILNSDYPNYLFFENKMREEIYGFNAVPIRTFIKSILPDATVTYDHKIKTAIINCNGSY